MEVSGRAVARRLAVRGVTWLVVLYMTDFARFSSAELTVRELANLFGLDDRGRRLQGD